MSYKALLFCPDDKAARLVTQVLQELDFTVELAAEPFATVKRLTDEQFHALVVDCENEQNASLLFKGARNSTLNHSSLYVAVVEGQAGVAKAFRIGANLVLTKPINIDQSKNTLRVARGLLRKNEAQAASSAAVEPANQASKVEPPTVTLAAATRTAAAAAPGSASAALASDRQPAAITAIEVEAEPEKRPDAADAALLESIPAPVAAKAAPVEASPTAPKTAAEPLSVTGLGSTAAAVQPALEKPTAMAKAAQQTKASNKVHAMSQPTMAEPAAPSFLPNHSHRGGGLSKALPIWATIVVMAGLGYAGWLKRDLVSAKARQWFARLHSSAPQTPPPAPVLNPAPQREQPAVEPTPVPESATESPSALVVSSADSRGPQEHESTVSEPVAVSEAPAPPQPKANVSPKVQPLEVKTGHRMIAKADQPAPPALPVAASAGNADLSGIVSSGKAPAPVLGGAIRISQGVSQGLLIKKVAPVYPAAALALRQEGTVELLATIGKSGAITKVKVLAGDPSLAESAVNAVRQWKYRPYLLNSEPLEIETQITIRFRLPN